MKNSLAYSLTRLGTDYVDLYQPARLDPQVPIEDTVGAIAEMIDAGYVRYLGLSEVGAGDHPAGARRPPGPALQIEYSLMSRGIEAEILPTVRELGHRRDRLRHPVPRPAEQGHGPARARATRGPGSPGSRAATWSATSSCSTPWRRSRSSAG